MEERQDLQPIEDDLREGVDHDDIFDGVLRDLVSREIAHQENREEGPSVIVEPIPGGESIVVGRRQDLESFHLFLLQENAVYREVEVGKFPIESENIQKVERMLFPRLSKARIQRGLPQIPIIGPVLEAGLELIEDAAQSLGLPVESKLEGGESEALHDKLDEGLEGFEPAVQRRKNKWHR